MKDHYILSRVLRFMAQNEKMRELVAREESVRERIDENGEKWTKKYFGGGAHFLNWLEQYKEVYGEKNVRIEEIDSRGFSCFEKGNEKMYRIWVKERK
jgi:hypothetical protein